MSKFYEIIEETSQFTIDEQESFVEIIQKRILDEKRKQFINEVKKSTIEFDASDKYTSSIDDIMKEIIS